MKAIIFNNFNTIINGAVIDFIEYYLCIIEQNKEVKLLILNYNSIFKKILIDLIHNRYELNGLDFEKNIVGINIHDLMKIKFDRLLILDYSTISKIKGLISLKNENSKILIISTLTDRPNYFINKSLYPEGCVVYYGEMPFVYKDLQYRHKFLFSKFKKLTKVDKGTFVNSPKNNDYSFLENYKNILGTKKIIYKTGSHKKDLFELFDSYIYYHAGSCFDLKPRLMIECEFYEKNLFYFNPSNIIDGSFYRFKDINEFGLKDRYLTKDDEIVRQFI